MDKEKALEAASFYATAQDTFNKFLGSIEFKSDEPREADVNDMRIIPAITNMAFACEIAMKSLLPSGTRGHKIKELFNLLPLNCKTEIKEFIKGEFHLDDNQFENKMDEITNSFAEWRYPWDARGTISGEYSFLKLLAEEILDMYGLDYS